MPSIFIRAILQASTPASLEKRRQPAVLLAASHAASGTEESLLCGRACIPTPPEDVTASYSTVCRFSKRTLVQVLTH